MRDVFVEQEARDFSTPTWPSPVKSNNVKSDPSTFEISQYWQRYRTLAGSPFDSDSDSSSDEDDATSLGSSDLSSTIREAPFKDVPFISEDLNTLGVIESNALGLVFMSKEDVLATEAVATIAQQAEGLRAPPNHQDDRSCGRPTQKYHAQQEHVAFQLDGSTEDTLVGRFPQDIGLWADVSDDTGPKGAHSYGDGSNHPYTYEYNPPCAPRKCTIPLPKEDQDDGEELLYGGPDLGGWLTGTLDGVPKVTLSGLSCLDIGLPMPFAMEN